MAHIEKQPFDKKWKKNGNGEWEGAWQTKGDEKVPDQLPEYMEHMRIWAFEMSEWAKQVINDWEEVTGRISHLDEQLVHVGDVLSRLSEDVAALKATKGTLPPRPS